MMKIKNLTGQIVKLHLHEFQVDELYEIPKEDINSWANNDDALAAIVGDTFQMYDGDAAIVGVSNQINFLKQLRIKSDIISLTPFAAKTDEFGRRYFRRVHGLTATLVANGNKQIDFIIPYDTCKITACEIICPIDGVTADFEVYAGTAKLNQFGFDCNITKGFYRDESPYDADLVKNLTLRATLKNGGSDTPTVCLNYILHEVKP